MRKVFIYLLILSFGVFAGDYYTDDGSGGKFYNYQKKVQDLEKQQIEIQVWVRKTNEFLAEYEGFIDDYSEVVTSIKIDGANCIIYREKYNKYYNKYGASHYQTITYERFYKDCKNMKVNRLNALKDIKSRVDDMKKKVDELKTKLDLAADKERQIMSYVNRLRNDRKQVNAYRNLGAS